jgi:Na+/H+-dicarboxylate symporter
VRAVRPIVVAVCAVGVAGMIATSIADSAGGALAFGLVTTAAVLVLMVASAVAAGDAPADMETQAARVEALVGEVVAAGADEHTVRRLVGEAVRLGRGAAGGPAVDA